MKKMSWMLLGGVAIGAYLLFKKGSSSGVRSTMKSAPVGANESVTAATYTVIATRRPGMNYVQATGKAGGQLAFASPSKGVFTRKVVSEGGALWAEIAPA